MMKQEWTPEIRQEAERIAADHGDEVVDLAIKGARAPKLLQVLVDRQGGITVDECAAVSRELSAWIDQRFPESQAYRLEVSSPGLDRILRTGRDFERNLGRTLTVEWSSEGKIRQSAGVLQSADGDAITIADGERVHVIPAGSVVWAKIKLKW